MRVAARDAEGQQKCPGTPFSSRPPTVVLCRHPHRCLERAPIVYSPNDSGYPPRKLTIFESREHLSQLLFTKVQANRSDWYGPGPEDIVGTKTSALPTKTKGQRR